MKRRDRRRWEQADLDKDDKLTKEELTSFLHPEEIEHMKHIMVEETMEDIDKDHDGKISLDEYVGVYFSCLSRCLWECLKLSLKFVILKKLQQISENVISFRYH